jgi:hypothetical protein
MAKKEILKVYDDSTNYTCQVIKLPAKKAVPNLDRLVEVTHQGNSVLISKDSPEDDLYLFFPAECQISHDFLSKNNLYRHETLNADPTQKGFFEDNRRVKAIKFKGIISSGFIIPLSALPPETHISPGIGTFFTPGDEFNEVSGYEVCKKYVRKRNGPGSFQNPRAKVLDNILDSKLAPEHPDTGHLMRNLHKFDLKTPIVVSYKLHGTSARTYNTLVKRKLTWKDRLAKWFGAEVKTEEYDSVVCSRRQVKSVGFEELPNKNHFFTDGDLWSEWAKKNLEGKLNKGESIYYELIGQTYTGQPIQGNGYDYGITEPKAYVYRIANINPQGIEVDLSYEQMKLRASQLGLEVCPEFFKGTFGEFIDKYDNGQTYVDFEEPMTRIFYNKLLEKPSILDPRVIEEGFCVRIESSYPKPEIFKIKSKIFLKQESDWKDKEDSADMEEEEAQTTDNAESNN